MQKSAGRVAYCVPAGPAEPTTPFEELKQEYTPMQQQVHIWHDIEQQIEPLHC